MLFPLTKVCIPTKCIPKKDIIEVVKSNIKRLAEIKMWRDGQEIGSNVSISKEIKRAHTLSEGDWSVTLLREQQDGERHSGGLKGRSFFSPELGAKDGMVSLLYRFWKPITVKWEKEPKDCVPLSGAAEGVARMGFSVQWWRIWENGGRAKWREELEEAKYTAMSLLWLHFSSLIELWGWFSTQLTAAECIHALLKGTFPKIIPATVQSWSNQDPTSCIHSDWALWEKF